MCDHTGVQDVCNQALELWQTLRARNPSKGNPRKKRINAKLRANARRASRGDNVSQHLGGPIDEDVPNKLHFVSQPPKYEILNIDPLFSPKY